MKKMIRITTALLFILLSACSGINSVAPFDKEQAKILLKQSAVSTPARQGVVISPRPTYKERAHLQTELIAYAFEPDIDAMRVANNMLEEAKKDCEAPKGRILNKTSHAVLYQYDASHCNEQKPIFLIGKAFNGEDGVYIVTFSLDETDIAMKQRGIRMIQSATLVDSSNRRR